MIIFVKSDEVNQNKRGYRKIASFLCGILCFPGKRISFIQ
ncbi:hypothetical protein GCWU000282_01701 [Catonella morbi ATCC 51271]|uniref:Uncharacterized protein n=1 Tax=Catonella morbi ATCC 51271 TaxID=592026 RepID=V2Y545_9FIRM|nr:hypothetical protein GCWU000282_01701 [Catonella morbi ATCC 51271]